MARRTLYALRISSGRRRAETSAKIFSASSLGTAAALSPTSVRSRRGTSRAVATWYRLSSEIDFSPRSTSPMNFPLRPERSPSRSWLSNRCFLRERRRCPKNFLPCLTGSLSREVHFDRGAVDADGIDGDREVVVHAAPARRELEVVAVPGADDDVSLEPPLGERALLVRAARAGREEPPAARVEDGERGSVALDQCALPDGEVPNLGHLHERHQRGSFDASSMMRRSSSTETAPSTRRPLTNSVGVARTPSAAACSMSASTSGAKRRSFTHRVKTARSRPRVLA